jgi:hypothetical protein
MLQKRRAPEVKNEKKRHASNEPANRRSNCDSNFDAEARR